MSLLSDSHENTTVVLGNCPYIPNENTSPLLKFYSPLPENFSLVNSSNIMCSLFHREGLLCSACLPGYGVSPYSHLFSCAKCDGNKYSALAYILLEFTPVTILYIIVVLFRVRATAPPLAGLVFFSHNTLNVIRGRQTLYTSLVYSTNWYTLTLLHIGLFMCSIWNLDFFRFSVPPFCVAESIGNVHVALLEYASAFYPLFLVLLTYCIITLHAHNVRFIVWWCKPFLKCLARWRQTWEIKRSIINAFSTFILLSYTKLLVVSFGLLSRTPLVTIDREEVSTVLRIDPQISYFGKEHAPIAILALSIILIINIPMILLVLYPTKLFQRLMGHCRCRAIHAVRMFIDTYQGCLKDGTDNTYDYRMVSAVYFMLRIVLLSLYIHYSRTIIMGLTLIIFELLFMFLAVIMGTVKPYKENYMNYCESFNFFLNGVALMLIYIWLYMPGSGVIVATLYALAILIPHVALIGYILIIFLRQRAIGIWVKKQAKRFREGYQKVCGRNSPTESLEDSGSSQDSLSDRAEGDFIAMYQLDDDITT